MNTPTLSQLAGIVAKAAFDARTAIGPISHDPRSSLWDKVDRVNEAIAKAVLDAVGYEFPVDPEREAFDAWVTANPSRSSNGDLFEAWNAGRAARDKETTLDKQPAPETFEAHGLTWFKHTPGDPMPCDGDAKINWLLSREKGGEEYTHWDKLAKDIPWGGALGVVGWRYATADAP